MRNIIATLSLSIVFLLMGCVSELSFFEAVQNNDYELVEKYIMSEDFNINQTTNDGATALHIAVFYGHLDMVYLLLENNIDSSILDGDGVSAMYTAAYLANSTIVALMLWEFNVDIFQESEFGTTAYDVVSIEFDDEFQQTYIDLGELIGYEFDLFRIEIDRAIIHTMFDAYLYEINE